MNVYKISYKTSWENEDIYEKVSLQFLAENAKEAIEKAEKFNNQETYFDDEEKEEYHRDIFELLEIELVIEDVQL